MIARRSLLGHLLPAVAMLAAVSTCWLLAQWQWHVGWRNEGRVLQHASSSIRDFSQLSTAQQWLPRTSIGARTRVSGVWVDQGTFTTQPRPTSAGLRPWVVSPLRLADGSILAVVRGAGTVNPSGAAPENRPVTIIGRLQPSESAPASGAWTPKSPELATGTLVDRWSFDIVRDGYLVADDSATLRAGASAIPRFTAAPSGQIGWRNLAYAAQWLLFALFALFVWWRHLVPPAEGE